ncbi:MAG: trigger factor [Acidobacteria bacterium]|nr:trigger factor [Acidobacteriota bacterium]
MAESCRRVMEIEIPTEVVREKLQAIAVHYQRHARLPGFRPGKAPLSIVRQKFEEDIRSQLLQELVPEYVEAEVKQHQWEPVGPPSVTDVEYAADSPLKFKATVEVLPEFVLQDYDSVKVEYEEPAVSDEEVQKTLEQLQAQAASYVNVEPRPIQDGDYASISVRGDTPGKEGSGVDLKEVLCEIGGPDTVAEFTQNLRGAELGQEVSFDVVYPPEFRDGRLAGKTIAYRVKVLGIKRKHLPPLDDEFAKELGEFDTLDALRARIRENLEHSGCEHAESDAKKVLRKRLVELHDFSVPASLVERQIERRMDRLRRHLASQGMDPERLAWDWNKVRDSQREEALEEVKGSLILEKIADRDSIEVDEAELDCELARLAQAMDQPEASLRARLTSEGGIDKIKARLRIEKALERVFQNVKVKSLRAGQSGPGAP